MRSLLTTGLLLAASYLLPLDSAFTTSTVPGLAVGVPARVGVHLEVALARFS